MVALVWLGRLSGWCCTVYFRSIEKIIYTWRHHSRPFNTAQSYMFMGASRWKEKIKTNKKSNKISISMIAAKFGEPSLAVINPFSFLCREKCAVHLGNDKMLEIYYRRPKIGMWARLAETKTNHLNKLLILIVLLAQSTLTRTNSHLRKGNEKAPQSTRVQRKKNIRVYTTANEIDRTDYKCRPWPSQRAERGEDRKVHRINTTQSYTDDNHSGMAAINLFMENGMDCRWKRNSQKVIFFIHNVLWMRHV